MISLSRVIERECIKESPIRKIMEMTDRKNIAKLGLNPSNVISFAGGWVDHEAPEGLREEYARIAGDKSLFHKVGSYSLTEGDFEFRTLLAKMEKDIYGVSDIDEDNIIVVQSSTQGLFGLLQTLLNPEDRVLLFDPTYANYIEQIHACQNNSGSIRLKVFDEVSWVFMKDEDSTLSSLGESVKKHQVKAILFSSPDNPTGQIFSDKFIEETLRLALKQHVFVLIDNAYKAQWFTKRRPTQFSLSPEDYENLVTIQSNSKWCRGLGRRLGWVEAAKNVACGMKAFQQATILCPDTMHQVAMTGYLKRSLENGSLKMYLEETRKRYKNAAEFTTHCIEKRLGMRCLRPQGGLYTVVDVGMDGEEFVERVLKNTGVVFVPGKGFGESLTNGIRVSYGPLVTDLNRVDEGFSRVQEFLESSNELCKKNLPLQN